MTIPTSRTGIAPRHRVIVRARPRAWGALCAAALVALGLAGCGSSERADRARPDPGVDRKIERLLALLLEVEQSGGSADDSLSAAAGEIIRGLGGEDSTADLLAERLLENADRWLPLLDSLSRVASGAEVIERP